MKLFLILRQKTAGQCSIVAARSKRDAINKITRLEGLDDAWAIRVEEFMITFKMGRKYCVLSTRLRAGGYEHEYRQPTG